MPETKDITAETNIIFSNTDSTNMEITAVYNTVTINNAPTVNSPIFVDVNQDEEYFFDPNDILSEYNDVEGNDILTLKIEKSPKKGDLRINGIVEVVNEQVINFSDINLLSYTPPQGETGAVFARIEMRVKDDGEQPRPYSDIFEVIFNVIPVNQEPTVSDNILSGVTYGTTVTLTVDLFIKDYLDPEGDPLGSIVISTIPAADQGNLLFNAVAVVPADLPLTVTAAELLSGALEYEDTGAIKAGKQIDIVFEVFDNVP